MSPPVTGQHVSSIFMPSVEFGNSSTLAEKVFPYGQFSVVTRHNWVRFVIHPKTFSSFRVSQRIYCILLYHGAIIRTGITCKKISCDMPNSDCRWLIVQNVKILRSYVKHFWIFPLERNLDWFRQLSFLE